MGEGGSRRIPFAKNKRRGECQYHLCHKQDELIVCPYCGERYCAEHKKPTMPFYSGEIDYDHEKGVHPCVGYDKYKQERDMEEDKQLEKNVKEAYIEAEEHKSGKYSDFVERTRREYSEAMYKKDVERQRRAIEREKAEQPPQETEQYKFSPPKVNFNFSWIKSKLKWLLLAVVLILIILGILWLANSAKEYGTTCYSGVLKSGECSLTKPQYCINGTLIDNPAKCGCPNTATFNGTHCLAKCGDVISGYCSPKKPLMCVNGALIKNATYCGCPNEFYKQEGEDCIELTCEDGTKYNNCSFGRPYFCSNGKLIPNPPKCGCPKSQILSGDVCISKYRTYPQERTYDYVVHSKDGEIDLTVYGGLDAYLAGLSRYFTCNPDCPDTQEMQLSVIENEVQAEYLDEVVEKIKAKSSDPNEQARIAISLVQNIPYDTVGFETNTLTDRYPYEVLYENRGVCGEKSRLLAYLLKELGFGVVLFDFIPEQHMALGIKCSSQYDYLDSGYCFVETTQPTIITYSQGEYVGVGEPFIDTFIVNPSEGKLTSTPLILNVSEGNSLGGVAEEYEDAQEFNDFARTSGFLSQTDYNKYYALVNKYGLILG